METAFQGISVYDMAIIGFYLVFMIVIGIAFKAMTKDTSEYFRGGGAMSWWMVGASSFVTLFTAWTFVGCAGKIYNTGTITFWLFISNFISLIMTLVIAPKFRRLRVITWVTAIRDRYGKGAEQLYAWTSLAFGFVFGGVGLYTLGIFMSPLFGLDMYTIIIMIGVVVLVMTLIGGSWGVVAGDFVQCLIITVVAVMTAILVVNHKDVGSLSVLLEKIPPERFSVFSDKSMDVVLAWMVAILFTQFISGNSLQIGACRFLTVRNDREARLATIIPMVGMVLLPIIAFIPPLASTFIIPNLDVMLGDKLNQPSEASYVVMAMHVLPQGMVGLLACAIFAASLTSMNTQLNINAGVLVKNVYHPIFHPNATDKQQMVVAKVAVTCVGLLLIAMGILWSRLQGLKLFELTITVAAMVGLPQMIPMLLGIFVKKVPDWTAWTTVVIGFVTGWLAREYAMEMYQFFAGAREYSYAEMSDIKIISPTICITFICFAWFFLTKLFYKGFAQRNPEKVKRVEEFFDRLATPIDEVKENVQDNTDMQAATVGTLCLIYGSAVALGVFIPNDFGGRICFLICGGFLLGIGLLLRKLAKKCRMKKAAANNSMSS